MSVAGSSESAMLRVSPEAVCAIARNGTGNSETANRHDSAPAVQSQSALRHQIERRQSGRLRPGGHDPHGAIAPRPHECRAGAADEHRQPNDEHRRMGGRCDDELRKRCERRGDMQVADRDAAAEGTIPPTWRYRR
jgi:hypothetical protein